MLIDDNTTNQLIAENNLKYIDSDISLTLVNSYSEARDWCQTSTPLAIIVNERIWSFDQNIFTFLESLTFYASLTTVPVFISGLAIEKSHEKKLFEYNNVKGILEAPLSLLDAATVVNMMRNLVSS